MMLQALVVSKDDQTTRTLIELVPQFGAVIAQSSAPDNAIERLEEDCFDLIIADFDDPETASTVIDGCRSLAASGQDLPVIIAVLADARRIREILSSGAHFVLTKPINPERCHNIFMAALSVLRHTRREGPRVAVQAPVAIRLNDGSEVEGILLELSAVGMEVLVAQPLAPAAVVRLSLELPDGVARVDAEAKVSWGLANGQSGLRFLHLDQNQLHGLAACLGAHSHEGISEDTDAVAQCKLTDLSLGACYIETESPFPQSCEVDLCLRAAQMEIQIPGLVRVMHPERGMGIEFTREAGNMQRGVGKFIDFLSSHAGTDPQAEVVPRSLAAAPADVDEQIKTENNVDTLLDLLRSGGALDQEEFLAALASQRTAACVS